MPEVNHGVSVAGNATSTTIPTARYNELLAAERELNALYAAGVDNWEGYQVACGEDDEDE
jgi:hypothetical protein